MQTVLLTSAPESLQNRNNPPSPKYPAVLDIYAEKSNKKART
jgi:hypothetical protein